MHDKNKVQVAKIGTPPLNSLNGYYCLLRENYLGKTFGQVYIDTILGYAASHDMVLVIGYTQSWLSFLYSVREVIITMFR